MHKKFLIFILFLVICFLSAENVDTSIRPQVESSKPPVNNTSRGLTVTPLGPSLSIDDFLTTLLGDDVSVFNVQYTGADIASGVYQGGGSAGISIDEGIILSSGYAANAIGPNNTSSKTGNNGLPGDPELGTLIPGYTTWDASILEFDFIPEFNSITFDYVFASEEYPEYVGTSFNDVFGFFLDGVNVAIIPGTTVPVSINNVNDHSYEQYYINNHNLMGNYDIQCDGFTTVLSVSAFVTPGETHHIRFGIADAGDHVLDSWVFIEAESFSSVTYSPPFSVFVEGGQQQYTNEEQILDILVTVTGPNNASFNWWLMDPIWGSASFLQPRDLSLTRTIRYIPLLDYCNAPDIFGFIVWDNFGHCLEVPLSVYVVPVNDPPENTVPPVISGDFMVGGTVVCDPGEWNDDKDNQFVQPGYESNITLFYQWQISTDGTHTEWDDIPGAIEPSFNLTMDHADSFILCLVTAQDDGIGNDGESTELESNIEYCPELVDSEEESLIPGSGFTGIYPNPFNPSTNIQLSIAEEDVYDLVVYDLKGRKIRDLHNGILQPGNHVFSWNGTDNNAEIVSSGLYFCILRSGQIKRIEKLMLIK